MHTIEPARLKPGAAIPPPDTGSSGAGDVAATQLEAARLIRGRALIFWDPKSPARNQEARRDRHRSDHAGRRLRVREPRDARRALEGRLVPLPDAGLPRARAPRRDVRHRRRSLRDRIVARDEPGRAQGRRRRSRPRDGRSSAATTWATSSAATRFNLGLHVVQSPEAVADAQDGDEFTFDPVIARSSRNVTQGKTYDAGAAHRRRKTRSAAAAASSRSAAASSAASVRRAPVDRLAGRRSRAPDDDDRADRLGASRRQGAAAEDLKPGDDAARLRRSAAGVGRHGAVRDPHLQPDHRRQHDLSAPGGDRQRSLRLHRRRRRRQADEHRPRVRAACTASRSRTTRRRATASSISTFPSRGW